jgi:hypothetical protein
MGGDTAAAKFGTGAVLVVHDRGEERYGVDEGNVVART